MRSRSNGRHRLRRRRLERIESDKDQLGERVVAAGENALVAAGSDAIEGMPDRVRAGGAGIRDDLARCRDAERFLRVHHRLLRRVIGDQVRRVPVEFGRAVQHAIIFFAERHAAAGRARRQ